MQRQEAIELVKENVSNKNLVNHMISVGVIMKGLANKLNRDEVLWELTGILHDIDYEETANDFKRHGLLSAEMLERKLPEKSIKAIKSHNFENTGVNPKSKMDFALICSDALSGLLVACALIKPSKKIQDVEVKSVKKKFKSKDFARNVKRENIDLCEKLGITRTELFEIGLESMKKISSDIGL